MSIKFSDSEIEDLIQEEKFYTDSLQNLFSLKNKRGHRERDCNLQGKNGNQFLLILRQSQINSFAFSVILAIYPQSSYQLFRLLRYNGNNHGHNNRIECQRINGFHIHKATERYQESGGIEDRFVLPASSYYDYQTAVGAMIQEGHINLTNQQQLSIL